MVKNITQGFRFLLVTAIPIEVCFSELMKNQKKIIRAELTMKRINRCYRVTLAHAIKVYCGHRNYHENNNYGISPALKSCLTGPFKAHTHPQAHTGNHTQVHLTQIYKPNPR